MSQSVGQFRLRNARPQRKEEEVADTLKQNRSRIEEMRNSNNVLREELETERRLAEKNTKLTEETIIKLQKEGVYYAQRVTEELKKKELIAQHIEECRRRVDANKSLLRNPEGDHGSSLWREIREKEGVLEKNLQAFNEAHSSNKNLRSQINHLRKERSLYDKVYYNLEMDIMKKKERLMKLIAEADKKEAARRR